MNGNQGFHTVRGYEILGKQQQVLSHSMEDYLEMIYRSSMVEGYTRINTLAELLNVQAPSATRMVQKLSKLGFVKYERYSIVRLTPKGEKVGKFLLDRHQIIEEFLKLIGVEDKLLKNVELIEHNVTVDALNKIEMLNKFFNTYPETLEKFMEYRMACNKKENGTSGTVPYESV
ncbi:iron dependent repressor, metal binding and dimerization domain protein [Lutispora thermophila]|uniref:Manganese transport regulator n=1 Tax=Lutispora thermophila DSM 19022 TaxID=1122184 RepID=A0A1M6E5D5_9FIRM|nr:iron dependent repressor, metal binding and dimerization domain protein [Lutispora thermophila]SHI80716.1 iron (metal) dependent repressor, DtxR family [Lutispora thermophila DSM 19022]